jgi:hypothetical protein
LDAIAYREAMPADDARRAELPGLRDKLACGDAEKPAFIVPVDYQIPVIPCLTVAGILATRKNEE